MPVPVGFCSSPRFVEHDAAPATPSGPTASGPSTGRCGTRGW